MLSVRDVTFSYPGAYPGSGSLFEGLSLNAAAGEVIAIVGRNGAGKSTFLRLLNGLLRPTSGEIEIDGKPTKGLKINEIAGFIGTLFQTPEQQLFAATVAEEVRFGPRQFRLPEAVIETRVASALTRCGLVGHEKTHPLDLGYAERRFVALASILVNEPNILLLDEPQRGLDRIWQQRLEHIIAEEQARGRTILFVCHDMNFVLRTATAILPFGGGNPILVNTDTFFTNDAALKTMSVERPMRLNVEDVLENSR